MARKTPGTPLPGAISHLLQHLASATLGGFSFMARKTPKSWDSTPGCNSNRWDSTPGCMCSRSYLQHLVLGANDGPPLLSGGRMVGWGACEKLNSWVMPWMDVMRSYQGYYTRSHQNSEVKRLWAGIVLGWVTSREVPVLHPFCCSSYLLKDVHFHSCNIRTWSQGHTIARDPTVLTRDWPRSDRCELESKRY